MTAMAAKVSKLPRAEQWANRISTELGKTVEAILDVGRLLVQAKADLDHGEWGRMFEERLLPFTQNTAHRLMLIAKHPVLSNCAHGHNLPPSWRTLYDLARIPEPTLKRAITDGLVTPEMERKHIKALLPPKRKQEKPKQPSSIARSPCSELYFQMMRVLSDFDTLSCEEQQEFIILFEQTLDHLRATANLT